VQQSVTDGDYDTVLTQNLKETSDWLGISGFVSTVATLYQTYTSKYFSAIIYHNNQCPNSPGLS
jgi:hypothetical protein